MMVTLRGLKLQTVLAFVVLISGLAGGVPAQDAGKSSVLRESSLSLVPQDVAFYSANLNQRKAWQSFIEGAFVSRLRGLPYIQRLEAELLAQWENPEGPMRDMKTAMKSPNVKSLLELLVDMNSREMFVYGEKDWNEAIYGLMKVYSDMDARSDDPEAMREFLLGLNAEYLEDVQLPTTVIGFRINKEETARTMLDALQGALQLGLQQIPELAPLAKQIVRKDFKDGQVLTISLSASLIPLDKVEGEGREILSALVEALGERQLVVSLGLRAKTLLLAISSDAKPLLQFGESEKLLEHDRMEVLEKNLPADLRNITFFSKDWRDSQWDAAYGSYFQNVAGQLVTALESEESEEVDIEEWQSAIMLDAEELDEILESRELDFDASLSWTYASDVGLEGMAYDWSKNSVLENAEPMTIVRNVGAAPLMMVAAKSLSQPMLVTLRDAIIERAPAHIRSFIALAESNEENKELILEVVDKGWPLVEDAVRIIDEEIIPAMDSREVVMSIAAQWTTTELSPDFPPADQALPIPEVGAAFKLTNRDQFLSGCQEMFGLFDRVVDLVREIKPDAVPVNYSIPRPEKEELAGATKFFYSKWSEGMIPGFEPQVIVSNDAVVVAYSARQAGDMNEAKPLATRPAWLAPEAPVASMSYVDFAGIMNTISPWVRYGFMLTIGDLDTPLADAGGPVPTGNDVLQVWESLTALGKTASTTVIDDSGATVSRWVWVGE